MNEQEIKLPELDLALFYSHEAFCAKLREYREAENVSDAFKALYGIESHVRDMMNAHAVEAVKLNTPSQQASEPTAERIPFDLEAAKRGDPLVTRDGRNAKFVAYVPEAAEEYRLVVLIDGDALPVLCSQNGEYDIDLDHRNDLFMAPKPKRTVWVNFYSDSAFDAGVKCAAFANERVASLFSNDPNAVSIAIPVQIDV